MHSGFKLAMFLTLAATFSPMAVLAAAPREGNLVAPLTDQEAWARLPKADKGIGQPLPSWARMLAASLPKTTAALLELDLAHRTKSPLDPKLRAAMRWVAAHANHCAYGEAYAAFDARRAGLDDASIEALRKGNQSGWSVADKAALEFARKMTVESAKISDDEFSALAKNFGDKNAAAMVLLMAYANFQDRLLTCLGAHVEEGGPMAPVEVAFKPALLSARSNPPSPPVIPPLPKPTGKDLVADDSEWASLTYDALQAKLENQRSRSTRLPVPSWDELKSARRDDEGHPGRLEPGGLRLCPRAGRALGSRHVDQRRGEWPKVRPGVWPEPVLGRHPLDRLSLLHGPLRDELGSHWLDTRPDRRAQPSSSPATTGRASRRPSNGPSPSLAS